MRMVISRERAEWEYTCDMPSTVAGTWVIDLMLDSSECGGLWEEGTERGKKDPEVRHWKENSIMQEFVHSI